MRLVVPGPEHLPAYRAALAAGWSPNTERAEAAAEDLALVDEDAEAFLAAKDDPAGAGPPITLPDGTRVARLPGFTRWMWDDGFCGMVNARWQPGTTDLPPHCLGHVGYAVVPARQRRGYATEALRQLLPEVRAVGLPFVDLVCDRANTASRRVIEANGGTLVREFAKPAQYGGAPAQLWRITLG